jgi:hypothetical protein
LGKEPTYHRQVVGLRLTDAVEKGLRNGLNDDSC